MATPTEYRPEWRGIFEGWSKQWVSKHHWKVRHHCPTFEDAVQQCGLVFAYCNKYYVGKVDNPAWFMALFKTAVSNTWIKLAKRDSRTRDLGVLVADFDMLRQHETTLPTGDLVLAAASASPDLLKIIQFLAEAPPAALAVVFADDDRDKINKRLRRFCKLPHQGNYIQQLRAIFKGEEPVGHV